MPRVARVVAFSTTAEMAEEIDRIARTEGRSRSELLRDAVRCYQESRGASIAAESAATYAPRGVAPATPEVYGIAAVLRARAAIRQLCESLGVARLWLFGSAVRDDFDPDRSDYDFLVEWKPDAPRQPWAGEYQDLRDGLMRILSGPVDVGSASAITNPYLKASIDAEKVLIVE